MPSVYRDQTRALYFLELALATAVSHLVGLGTNLGSPQEQTVLLIPESSIQSLLVISFCVFKTFLCVGVVCVHVFKYPACLSDAQRPEEGFGSTGTRGGDHC